MLFYFKQNRHRCVSKWLPGWQLCYEKEAAAAVRISASAESQAALFFLLCVCHFAQTTFIRRVMARLPRVCVLASALTLCCDSFRPMTYRWLLQARDFRNDSFWPASSSPVTAEATVKNLPGPALCFCLSTFCSAFSSAMDPVYYTPRSCMGTCSLFSLASLLARQYLISAYVWGVIALAEIGKLLSALVLKGKGASLAQNSRPLSITVG